MDYRDRYNGQPARRGHLLYQHVTWTLIWIETLFCEVQSIRDVSGERGCLQRQLDLTVHEDWLVVFRASKQAKKEVGGDTHVCMSDRGSARPW